MGIKDKVTGTLGNAFSWAGGKLGEGVSWAGKKAASTAKSLGNDFMNGASEGWNPEQPPAPVPVIDPVTGQPKIDATTGQPVMMTPEKTEDDLGVVGELSKFLSGGLKNNWLEVLVGLIAAFTVGKSLGAWVPGGIQSTIATMVTVGGIAAALVKSFRGAAEDDTPAKPVAKINLKDVPGGSAPVAPVASIVPTPELG